MLDIELRIQMYLGLFTFLLFFSGCKKSEEEPKQSFISGKVREMYTGKPIPNASIWIESFGSCGTSFCGSGSVLAHTKTDQEGNFKILRSKDAFTINQGLPDEIQKHYSWGGYGRFLADKSNVEFNPQPFSYLKLDLSIRNNRYKNFNFKVYGLTQVDYDQGAIIYGENRDTTFILKCFANSEYHYGYDIKNVGGDSMTFDIIKSPLGGFQDTFFLKKTIDVSTLKMKFKI